MSTSQLCRNKEDIESAKVFRVQVLGRKTSATLQRSLRRGGTEALHQKWEDTRSGMSCTQQYLNPSTHREAPHCFQEQCFKQVSPALLSEQYFEPTVLRQSWSKDQKMLAKWFILIFVRHPSPNFASRC